MFFLYNITLIMLFHVSLLFMPKGVTQPSPVITTLRGTVVGIAPKSEVIGKISREE